MKPLTILAIAAPFLHGISAQEPPKRPSQPQHSVHDAQGRPLAGSTVLLLSRQQSLFDSSPHIWSRITDKAGGYAPRTSFRFIGTWASHPGYAPGRADAKGRIVLRALPDKPLKIRKGHLRIDAKGGVLGFDFAGGKAAGPQSADILPVATQDWRRRATTVVKLQTQGRAAIGQVLVQLQTTGSAYQDVACTFLAGRFTRPGKLQKGRFQPEIEDSWGNELLLIRCRDGKGRVLLRSRYESRAPHDRYTELHFDYIYQPDPEGHLVPASTPADLRKLMPSGTWHRAKK